MNPIIEKLVIELEKVINGDPWYGTSLRVIYDGITCEQAISRYNENIYTIAEITLHILAWIEEVNPRTLSGAIGKYWKF